MTIYYINVDEFKNNKNAENITLGNVFGAGLWLL